MELSLPMMMTNTLTTKLAHEATETLRYQRLIHTIRNLCLTINIYVGKFLRRYRYIKFKDALLHVRSQPKVTFSENFEFQTEKINRIKNSKDFDSA